MKQACRWAFKGVPGSNSASALIYEYSQKKMLSKLGYSFDGNNLTTFEVNAYSIIASEFNKLESEELKKKAKRR